MPWEVMPDLFFYRDPEDAEKEEQERQKALLDAAAAGQTKQLEQVGGKILQDPILLSLLN